MLRQLNPGGIECWLERLIADWPAATRPEFHFALETPDFGSMQDRFRSFGVHLHYCPPPSRLLPSARQLGSLLAREGPFRAIHCHNHHASAFALTLAARVGIPIRVAHSHADLRAAFHRLGRRAYVRIARTALGVFANRKIAVSQAAAQDLFGDAAKAQIVPCAIAAEHFLSGAGLPDPSRFTLIHVGRLVPEKNHDFLLNLAHQWFQKDRRVRLWLVGEGPTRPHLERRVDDLGLREAVRFWGNRLDVPNLLAAADVFVFPSLNEGLGLAALEAQVAGLPVLLASHLPGELDLFPQRVRRLALDVPMEGWIEAACQLRALPRLSVGDRRERVIHSPYSMNSNIRTLSEIYAG